MRKTCEYIGFRGKSCNIVTLVGGEWFDCRNDGEILPVVGAFCKNCAKETAKPVYPIYMNGKPAYALRCNKCGGEYAMYKSMFFERYIGHTFSNGKGSIAPTRGVMSVTAAMDRQAKNARSARRKEHEEEMCRLFNYTHEEYAKLKKEWDASDAKARKKFESEQAEYRAKMQDNKIKQESTNRKELIERGILKYVKNIGLVNTETGEVIKL